MAALCHGFVIYIGHHARLETDTDRDMLHAENQDRLYLITPYDEQQSLVGSLAFNVQDRHWLVYCALGGHQHADLPETDLLTGVSVLDFYSQAARNTAGPL